MAQGGVTIAIPNWNHEVLLPRSIASALRAAACLRAEGTPAEVLVLDDASRDGSPNLLRRLEALYHKDGLRVLAYAENAGLAANRNAALARARHRYVAFLDADNELIPENLPLLVRSLEQTGAAAAYGNLLVRTPTADYAHNLVSNESLQDKMFVFNYVDAFAVFDRLQMRDAGGYDERLTIWEDYEAWLHLMTAGREVIFVPVALGYYYVLPGSMAVDQTKHKATYDRIRRTYDQLSARPFLPLKTRALRHHPSLGYL